MIDLINFYLKNASDSRGSIHINWWTISIHTLIWIIDTVWTRFDVDQCGLKNAK